MKIALYSPYLPKHFGGGESYLLNIAKVLADCDYQVDIFLNKEKDAKINVLKISNAYQKFLNQKLDKINWKPIYYKGWLGLINKLWLTKNYDVLFYLTDGSYFFSLAKKNIISFQFPFNKMKLNWMAKIKKLCWQLTIANSLFTKKNLELSKIKVDQVHYPVFFRHPARIIEKENIILGVGRFSSSLHLKRHDLLIEMLKNFQMNFFNKIKPWQLYLAGAVEDWQYLEKLKKQASNLPVKFFTNVNRLDLEKLFQQSKIFWHATGYQIDEVTQPLLVEHFGITTLEAMHYGVVPLVHGKGGQKELLESTYPELLWQTKEECLKKSIELVQQPSRMRDYSIKVRKLADSFSFKKFSNQLKKILSIL